MTTSPVRFSQLRRLLGELGFVAVAEQPHWRFEHPPSHTVFLFRPYQGDEKVQMADLLAVRSQLDWRGLLSAETFDDALKKAPA